MESFLIKSLVPAQVFSCEICEIFKNTYFEKYLRTATGSSWNVPLLRVIHPVPFRSRNTRIFNKQRFSSTKPQCCLTFLRIELQMLLRYCLIHITIIILRKILYLIYLCPCLGLGLLMLYLCDLFLIFSLIFIFINNITSLKQTHLAFVQFLKYLLLFLDDNVDEESEPFSNWESSASGWRLGFA